MQEKDSKSAVALETEQCRWFKEATQLLGHVNRFHVEAPADHTDIEYLDYLAWIGDARFVGDLDLRPSAFESIIVGMGAFKDEHWVNTLTLSFIKYCLTSGGTGSFDGFDALNQWIRTSRPTCLYDPYISRWLVCAFGCIELLWVAEDSREEFAELRHLIDG